MTFIKVKLYSFLLFSLHISSSRAFTGNFNGGKEKLAQNEMRPDLNEIVDQQENRQLNIQLHVGDEETGFLTIQDMIIQLGGRYNENEEDRVELPGSNGPASKFASGGRRLSIASKGTYVNMKGLQHIDCEKGSWQICWKRDKPAGQIVFGFHLPQTYSRNKAILPGGNLWLSFPIWSSEGLKIGQTAKREVLDEIEMYNRKWNEELEKYAMTNNPIMKAIHERNADMYATKCDDLYDFSLDTIPDDEDCFKLQEDLLLSNTGLIWKKDGKNDVLLGHTIASPSEGQPLSSFSSGKLRP